MPTAHMPRSLPQSAVQTRSKEVRAGLTRDLRTGDIPAKRAVKTEEERNAIRWAFTKRIAPYFDRACEVYCRDLEVKAHDLAERMTVDQTVLSSMRAGERQISEVQLEVLRAHRPSRLILAEADRDRPALTFAMLRDRIAEIVIEDAKRGGLLGRVVLDEAARREGVTRDDVDGAVDQGVDEDGEPAPTLLSADVGALA